MEWYAVLGLDANNRQNITMEDIKRSYRMLVLKHHPDKSGGDTDRFIALRKAYAILSDEHTRERYDHTLPHSYSADFLKDVVIGIAQRIPILATWQPDIYITVAHTRKRYHVTLMVYRHHIRGSVITFNTEQVEAMFTVPNDLNEEYLIAEGYGNDVILDGRVKRGDLLIDISTS